MRSTDRAGRNARGHDQAEERPGWPLERVDDADIVSRCNALGIEVAKKTGRGDKGAAKRREALARGLADPSLVSRVLSRLSAFELVLLESLVDLGGIVEVEALWDEACRRAQIERPFDIWEIERAIALLGCQLTERTPFGTERDLAGLLEPCCGTLSSLLSGVSLPARPPSAAELPVEAQRALQRLRDHLLVAGRCAQLRVKRTKSGAPSRTQRRKFEAEIPTDGEPLWGMLETAVELGLVIGSEQSEFLSPDLECLKGAADRGFLSPSSTPTVGVAVAWAVAGPVPVEHLVRHHQQYAQRKGLGQLVDRPTGDREIARILGSSLGLWCGKLGEQLVVACPGASLGEADGHILPNYDVILGPNTPLSAAAVLGCAAELVRLDRLASLRLTPESVRGAIALGLECSEILEALDRVGPRQAPPAVRRSVEEWAASTRLARIVRDRVVVLPPEAATRVVAGRGSQRMFELLAPGIVRVDAIVTEAKLALALEEAGVSLGVAQTGGAADDDPPEREAGASCPPSPEASETLDPDARARVHEALSRNEFPPLPVAVPEPRGRASEAPARLGSDDSGPASIQALMRELQGGRVPPAALEREMLHVIAVLERWHRKLRPKARAKVHLPDLLQPDGLAGLLLLLAPDARARILNRCTNPGQIGRRATAAILEGELSPLAAFGLDEEDEDPPAIDEFPVGITPRNIRRALDEAATDESPVWLLINRGGTKQVSQRLIVEAIEPRGRDLMLLARADDGSDGDARDADRFAIPLTSVASVLVEDGPHEEELFGLENEFLAFEAMLAEAARRRRGR